MPAHSTKTALPRFLFSALIWGLACLLVHPSSALDLDLPETAMQTALREEVATLQPLPSGVFTGSETPFLSAEGRVTHSAYRIASTSLTPFQMIAPLLEQLTAAGYRTLFACADTVCGGFDFRYLLDLLPEPHMHVDLGNFQYILTQDSDKNAVAIITSRARTAGFIHLTQIKSDGATATITTSSTTPDTPEVIDTTVTTSITSNLAQTLTARGSVALDDLAFETGSSALGDGPFASLASLAQFLTQNANARIILVGHTDAEGSLEGNISLSKKRATSVRDRLVDTYGVNAEQVSAQGVGYLSPRASNATESGRETNRRVEAVLATAP